MHLGQGEEDHSYATSMATQVQQLGGRGAARAFTLHFAVHLAEVKRKYSRNATPRGDKA